MSDYQAMCSPGHTSPLSPGRAATSPRRAAPSSALHASFEARLSARARPPSTCTPAAPTTLAASHPPGSFRSRHPATPQAQHQQQASPSCTSVVGGVGTGPSAIPARPQAHAPLPMRHSFAVPPAATPGVHAHVPMSAPGTSRSSRSPRVPSPAAAASMAAVGPQLGGWARSPPTQPPFPGATASGAAGANTAGMPGREPRKLPLVAGTRGASPPGGGWWLGSCGWGLAAHGHLAACS